MKQKLLLILLFFTQLNFAAISRTSLSDPGIGVIMWGQFTSQGSVYYNISVKNTSDQPLTNIYLTNIDDSSPFAVLLGYNVSETIATLAPGEENTTNYYALKGSDGCYDASQVMVHATTPNGDEITDLSHDYDYYQDGPSGAEFVYYTSINVNTTYHDNNGNSIVDVGDYVSYLYFVYFMDGAATFSIFDNNTNMNANYGAGQSWSTNGIHYITESDAATGYIFQALIFISMPIATSNSLCKLLRLARLVLCLGLWQISTTQ